MKSTLSQRCYNAIPIREHYKETKPNATHLRAPVYEIKFYVILEFFIILSVFTLSYYYSASTETTETIITFEILDSPYKCSILSPRNDVEEFGVTNSELAMFSSARYTYDECTSALSSNGYDVCDKENITTYMISTVGIDANDTTCIDVILTYNNRFCYGTALRNEIVDSNINSSFANQDYTIDSHFINTYFFTNQSGKINTIEAPFDAEDVISDFISDYDENIYVMATYSGSKSRIYRFSVNKSEADVLYTSDTIVSSNIYGFTFGLNCLFILAYVDSKVFTYKYNLTESRMSNLVTIDCKASPDTDDSDVRDRFVSVGDDNNLYVMCSSAVEYTETITVSGPGGMQSQSVIRSYLRFFQVNPYKTNELSTFYAKVSSIQYSNGEKTVSAYIDKIRQVIVVDNKVYFSTGPGYNNLLVAPFPANNNISNVQSLAVYSGSYVLPGRNRNIYFPDGNYEYLDVTDNTFKTVQRSDYYFPITMQLAFSYQICNGNHTKYVIDADVEKSFANQCGEKNGIYYQLNNYYDVPSSCMGYISSSSDISMLGECEGVKTTLSEFVDDSCKGSFAKVCGAEYTNNPPFSCSKTTTPTTLTNVATAFANASGAMSLIVMLMKFMLKRKYKHFFDEFVYDHKEEVYLDKSSGSDKYMHNLNKVYVEDSTNDQHEESPVDQYDDVERGKLP